MRHVEYYLSYAARGAEGFWFGEAAASLGLGASVDPQDFLALAEGTRPEGGRLLERVPDNRTPGWDFSFSAPKSVSVCFALADTELRAKIIGAHHGAVRAGLEFLETHGGRARRGLGGRDGHVAAGLAVACFTHPSSRELDPQLHTHGIILNVAQGADGRYTALDSRTAYLHKRAGAAIYRAELRSRLAALGATWKEMDRRGLSEMDSFEPQTLRALSTRRAQIEGVLAPGASSRSAQVACLATRRSKVDVELEVLSARWEAQGAQLGWDSGRVQQLLDGTDRRQGLGGGEQRRITNKLLSRRGLTSQAAAFTRDDAVVAWAEALPQGGSRAELEALADTTLVHEEVVPLVVADAEGHPLTAAHHKSPGTVIRLVRAPASSNGTLVTEPRYTTKELLETEARLLRNAVDGRGSGAGVVPSDAVDAVLVTRSLLSAEQLDMVRSICSSGDLVDVVVGVPGSGKTFALEAAKVAWTAGGYRVLGAALSAAAAAQLQAGSGIESQTLASLLWRLKHGQEHLDRHCVLVIDEAGMVDTRRMDQVIEAVRSAGSKLVLTGDDRQLPAVETGGSFAGLARRLGAARLVQNARQVATWERDALAALREGRTGEAAGSYDRHGRVHVSESPAELLSQMVARWWAARAEGSDAALFAYSRDAACVLNRMARACLESSGGLYGDELFLGEYSPGDLAERRYQAGDEICCLRNRPRLGTTRDPSGQGVRNGTRGVVDSVDPASGEICLIADDGRALRLPPQYVREFTDYGYAWTLHKGQGQTVGEAARSDAGATERRIGRAFIYGADALSAEAALTAASRATDSTELFVLVDPTEQGDSPGQICEELGRAWTRSEAEAMATDELETRRHIAQLVEADPDELGRFHRELTGAIGTGPVADPVALADETHRELGAAAVALDAIHSAEGWARSALEEAGIEDRAAARAELREVHRQHRAIKEEAELIWAASEGTDDLLSRQDAARAKHGTDLRLLAAELEVIDSALATGRRRRLDGLCQAPPGHIVALLGEEPDEPFKALRWRQGLTEIEDWRHAVGLGLMPESPPQSSPRASPTSPWVDALGEEPDGFEGRRYRRVKANLEVARRDLRAKDDALATASAMGSAVSPIAADPDFIAAVLQRPGGESHGHSGSAPRGQGRGLER